MLTGAQYRQSLLDGRRIFLDGRPVEHLLEHEAFAIPADAVAAGYDRFFSQAPGATNPYVVAPRSKDELRERAEIMGELDWPLSLTYQSLMTLLTAAARLTDVDPVYRDRLRSYVEHAMEADIRIAECITDAKGDRTLSPMKQPDPDAYVRVVARRRDGVVIRGAKLHITAASCVMTSSSCPRRQ